MILSRPMALLGALILSFGPIVALAQSDDETAQTVFAGDRYIAGEDLEVELPTDGDLFMAGEELELGAPVQGAAHMAGRRLEIDAPIGGAVYAFGYGIDVEADIGGAATFAGSEVQLNGDVGGNLRLFAADAVLGGTVAGSAILAANDLEFDGAVLGDLRLAVDDVDWGSDARVDGQLTFYVDGDARPDVPDRVASPDRIEYRDVSEFDDDVGPSVRDMRRAAFRAAAFGFLMSVLFVAALATGAIAIAPHHVAEWRERALDKPGRSLVAGFLMLSVIAGSGIVLALTIIGIPLLFAALLLAGLTGYLGYVLGSYILGVGIWLRLGNEMPEGVLPKAGLAALGAFVAGLIGLIPFLGWLVVLTIALIGLGAATLVIRGDGGEAA